MATKEQHQQQQKSTLKIILWKISKQNAKTMGYSQNAPKMPRPRAPYRKYHGVSSGGASVGPVTNPVNF